MSEVIPKKISNLYAHRNVEGTLCWGFVEECLITCRVHKRMHIVGIITHIKRKKESNGKSKKKLLEWKKKKKKIFQPSNALARHVEWISVCHLVHYMCLSRHTITIHFDILLPTEKSNEIVNEWNQFVCEHCLWS